MRNNRNQPMDWKAALEGLPPLAERLVHQKAETYRQNQHLDTATRRKQLLLAVRCLDLTSLTAEDSDASIRTLCALAKAPLGASPADESTVATVCVYPIFVPLAAAQVQGSAVQVASVAASFPTGLLPMSLRLAQIQYAVEAGAHEIDVVVQRRHILQEDWATLYQEVLQMRQACGSARLKVILETGMLPNLTLVAAASAVAMAGGADFIKTSTGKEEKGASLEAGTVMARAIQAHYQRTGYRVGLKPSGGIRSAQHALQWIHLVKEELGVDWLNPFLFRFGASSLLVRLQQQLRLLEDQ